MRPLLGLMFGVILAACAAKPSEPDHDTGTLIGEVGDPRNRAKLHTELASMYYSNGNLGVALEELRAAAKADANYAPAYGMYGLVYMQMKDQTRAEESFERALRLAPSDADINHNYGWFLCQTGREPASVKYFLQAIRNPLYAMPWRSYSAAGVCTMKMNQLKDAEAFFERALKLEPDEPASLVGLGQIRYRQGNIGEARKLVTRYNKLVTPTSESLWLAVRVERRMGERLQEQAFANQLRRRYPDSREFQALQRGQYD
ncbi:MAG TPA: type IV pilus biogenesis/stability protein PilW [Burkholderiales bacterium]|jgi:type IV pilus assembly protein PilF|nr:type IV pilus biogenesis/stability protein PilW [Burkholderiales bacterium]